MSNGEMRKYARAEVVPLWQDRTTARQVKAIYDRTKVDAFDAEARAELTMYLMEQAAKVDIKRKSLASMDDPVLDTLLGQFEIEGFEQLKAIQRRGRDVPPAAPRKRWDF